MSAVVSKPLLIELFTEELPPKALKKLGEAFAAGVEASLRSDGLLVEGALVASFATPRRLGVRVDAVLTEAPAKAIKEKLMPLAVAKDAAVSKLYHHTLFSPNNRKLVVRTRTWISLRGIFRFNRKISCHSKLGKIQVGNDGLLIIETVIQLQAEQERCIVF